jgi:hypothetical protein
MFWISMKLNRAIRYFVLLLTTSTAAASTWHVSWARLPSVPARQQFRTIQNAANQVKPGDRVIIHAGVYREAVTVKKSGTARKPIRFQAARGANVIVTGLDPIKKCHAEGKNVYSTRWTHRFIPWSKFEAHPDDEYHRLIGRAEQVVIKDRLLKQTLQRDQLSPGMFYVDVENEKLYVRPPSGENLAASNVRVEAAARSVLWDCKGDYVGLRGIDFRYAANPAQQGAVIFEGRGDSAEDCTFERMNGAGAAFVGVDQLARGCLFQENGQLGFGANHAHNFILTGCTVRNNNVKGFSTQWEAGGTKIVLSRGVIFEASSFIANHGPGVWFDIGNEKCTVRNCFIADNDNAGIYCEISYGLDAHDNVIVGNGFGPDRGAWGGQAGISLSSSPNCVVTRNLIIGNREGFDFREQSRTTPRIDKPEAKQEEPVSIHDERISNNVIAYNRDAQTRGWFDVNDDRHWPRKFQSANAGPVSLETLNIMMTQNVYAHDDDRPLFVWGTEWRRHASFSAISEIQSELNLEQVSQVASLKFKSRKDRDFRLPPDSAVFKTDCYPQGAVPGVKLGKLKN